MEQQLNKTRLEQIAALFAAHGVRFIVIGGLAEYLFGSPRVTYDIDLRHIGRPKDRESLNQLLAIKQARTETGLT